MQKGTVSITFKSFQGSVSEIKADEAIWYNAETLENQIPCVEMC